MLYASLRYDCAEFKKMTPDQQAVFEETWPRMKLIMQRRREQYKDDTEKINDVSVWEYETRQRITMEEAAKLQEAGIKLELEGIDGTMLQANKSNGQRHDKYGEIHSLDLVGGQVVQIAVPDLGVLQIDEVDWIEDACTQVLQGKLDDGWRILAVCPPNAQRRPDYILGRKKKDA